MPKCDYLNRRESNIVISYRIQMLINVIVWFLIGAFLAQVSELIIHFWKPSISIDWIEFGSFFAIFFGYIGWVFKKISLSDKK